MINKLKQFTKKEKPIALLVGVALMIYGVITFWIGWHSIDLAWNFERVTNEINDIFNSSISLHETTMKGEVVNIPSVYAHGVFKIQLGLFITLMGGILFGHSLAKIVKIK
jgi:hypothetical protein|tara:strand:- start:615 stop:944 length:330 start_codon:yes stop_codon:yes gene_type:complete